MKITNVNPTPVDQAIPTRTFCEVESLADGFLAELPTLFSEYCFLSLQRQRRVVRTIRSAAAFFEDAARYLRWEEQALKAPRLDDLIEFCEELL